MTVRGTEGPLRNLMHIPATAVMSLPLVLSMGFGAAVLGKRFRWYSIATIVTVLVFGALTSLQAPQLAANQPTPWMGLTERINIYATMLWFAVLGIALLRARRTIAPRQQGKPTVIPQRMQRAPQ